MLCVKDSQKEDYGAVLLPRKKIQMSHYTNTILFYLAFEDFSCFSIAKYSKV